MHINETSFAGHKSGPKSVHGRLSLFQPQRLNVPIFRVYQNIVNQTAKQGYRPDLRQAAVARASALRQSSRPVKETSERKPRGTKAKKARAVEKE